MALLNYSVAIDVLEADSGADFESERSSIAANRPLERHRHRGTNAVCGPRSVWQPYDRPGSVSKTGILLGFSLFLLLPIAGMLYFTFRSATGGFTVDHWLALFDASGFSFMTLSEGLLNSLMLVAVTLAIELMLVIPAFVLISVRFPRLNRAMGVIMLLPIAIPAIILVVGLAPALAFFADIVGPNTWTLALAYGILALPFVYTTISSDLRGLDCRTLAQAAESLGAGWLRTLTDILLPCIRRSIISSMLITTAIVLGEFTIASLLNRTTLQTALISISKTDVYLSVIVTLIVLLCTLVTLFIMATGNRPSRKES